MNSQFLLDPMFTQRQVVDFTVVGNMTLDNWVRYGHVEPDQTGQRRMFSCFDLIKLELIDGLTKTFGIKPLVARDIADYAADQYIDKGPAVRDWLSTRDGIEHEFEDDGVLVPCAQASPKGLLIFADNAPKAKRRDITLYVRSIARDIFAKIHTAGIGGA